MSKKNAAVSRAERAAAAVQAQEAAERRRRMVAIGSVVGVVLVLVAGIFIFLSVNDDTDGESVAPGASASETTGAGSTGGTEDTAYGASSVTEDYGFRYGATDAPHELVIYEDFLCPYCGQLEVALGERLDQAVRDGKVAVEFRPLNFLSRYGDYSLPAANAMAVVYEESGPDVAKEFHDLLYAEQPAEGGDLPDTDWLVEKAVEAGADEEAVRPGIEDGAFDDWVNEATDAASKDGINSTPTALLDGEPVEGATIEEIADAVFTAVE